MAQDGPDETVVRLRAAAAALDRPGADTADPDQLDPSDEAARFEELHAALLAVLDRTAEDAAPAPADPDPRT